MFLTSTIISISLVPIVVCFAELLQGVWSRSYRVYGLSLLQGVWSLALTGCMVSRSYRVYGLSLLQGVWSRALTGCMVSRSYRVYGLLLLQGVWSLALKCMRSICVIRFFCFCLVVLDRVFFMVQKCETSQPTTFTFIFSHGIRVKEYNNMVFNWDMFHICW
jgi:hypothetical protein